VTLNYLEQCNDIILRYFTECITFHYVKLVAAKSILSATKT